MIKFQEMTERFTVIFIKYIPFFRKQGTYFKILRYPKENRFERIRNFVIESLVFLLILGLDLCAKRG